MRTRQMDESQRGHGFTTLQIQHAPQGALYLWPVFGSLSYARDLAKRLGRDDLRIESGDILQYRAERIRGLRFSAIILDHACEPSDDECKLLRDARVHCCEC